MSWPFDPLPMFSFDVVMIDPPWPWEAYSDKGHEKSPEGQYETMTLDEIARLPVGDLCSDGGIAFCWGTWPLIDKQAAILKQWGFSLVTGGAWAKRTATGKLRWGTGYVLRSVCEPFLIGSLNARKARGSTLVNLIETLSGGGIDGVAREHSRKPDEAYALVEALAPDARRADVFSRQRRIGWSSWGREVSKFADIRIPDSNSIAREFVDRGEAA